MQIYPSKILQSPARHTFQGLFPPYTRHNCLCRRIRCRDNADPLSYNREDNPRENRKALQNISDNTPPQRRCICRYLFYIRRGGLSATAHTLQTPPAAYGNANNNRRRKYTGCGLKSRAFLSPAISPPQRIPCPRRRRDDICAYAYENCRQARLFSGIHFRPSFFRLCF